MVIKLCIEIHSIFRFWIFLVLCIVYFKVCARVHIQSFTYLFWMLNDLLLNRISKINWNFVNFNIVNANQTKIVIRSCLLTVGWIRTNWCIYWLVLLICKCITRPNLQSQSGQMLRSLSQSWCRYKSSKVCFDDDVIFNYFFSDQWTGASTYWNYQCSYGILIIIYLFLFTYEQNEILIQ